MIIRSGRTPTHSEQENTIDAMGQIIENYELIMEQQDITLQHAETDLDFVITFIAHNGASLTAPDIDQILIRLTDIRDTVKSKRAHP